MTLFERIKEKCTEESLTIKALEKKLDFQTQQLQNGKRKNQAMIK